MELAIAYGLGLVIGLAFMWIFSGYHDRNMARLQAERGVGWRVGNYMFAGRDVYQLREGEWTLLTEAEQQSLFKSWGAAKTARGKRSSTEERTTAKHD